MNAAVIHYFQLRKNKFSHSAACVIARISTTQLVVEVVGELLVFPAFFVVLYFTTAAIGA